MIYNRLSDVEMSFLLKLKAFINVEAIILLSFDTGFVLLSTSICSSESRNM